MVGKLLIAGLLWASSAFGGGFCTGVIIAKNTVLTAAHCVIELPDEAYSKKVDPPTLPRASLPAVPASAVKIEIGSKIVVVFADGAKAVGYVKAKGHPALIDAAIITVATGSRPSVVIMSSMDHALPDGCLFVGVGGNGKLKTMGCVLLPGSAPVRGLRVVQGNGLPGDSGGPVFGRKGELVGMVSRIDDRMAEIYVEPFYRLRLFLQENL